MSTIDDLERKVESLRAQLRDAEGKLRNARLAVAPVKVGDVIRTKDYPQARVCHVTPEYGSYTIVVNLRRKDGKWGTSERYVYGRYEVVSRVPAPTTATEER
jgi:hypothetical protein